MSPNPEWLQARCGKICSSVVDRFCDSDGNLRQPRAKADRESGRYAESVNSTVAAIAAERMTGWYEAQQFSNAAMDYANEHEGRALNALCMLTDLPFEAIGGVENGPYWASLDGAVIEGGRVKVLAEIKIVLPKRQIAYIMNQAELIDEHGTQVNAELAISEAERGILFAYSPECKSIAVDFKPGPIVENIRRSLAILNDLVESAILAARM